jgi:hypothetical protein
MSLSHSPSIITQNLVLCLDAANRKSYPGSGTTWTDLSGNGNNGTLTNGVGYNGSNLGSLVFDGVDDFISTTYSVGTISQHTISCWINKTNSQYSFILASSASLFYGFEIYPSVIYTNITANNFGQVSYNLNGYQNIAFTYDGSQTGNSNRLKVYLNGISQTLSFTGTIPSSVSNIPTIDIGKRSWATRYSEGSIAQVSIYNRALTASEIQQNYTALKSRFGLT